MPDTAPSAAALAVGKSEPIAFKHLIYPPDEGIDINDMIDIQDRIVGGIVNADFDDMRTLRFLFWICARKADPALSPDDRDACRYSLTEMAAGKLFKATETDAVLDFVVQVLQVSGLWSSAPDGPESGNAEAATE